MASNPVNTFAFEGHEVRVVVKDGNPWWVVADVCAALEIGNPSQAFARLDDDEKATLSLNEGHLESVVKPGHGPQTLSIVSESGLYSLIMRSRKPEARPFRRWVTHEVLPAIRKTGGYLAPEANLRQVVESSLAALGWNPEWKQAPAEKLEQARKDARGSYTLIKDKVLPALDRILDAEIVPPADPTLAKDIRLLQERVAHLMAQFKSFDSTLRPALQAPHIMLRPLQRALETIDSLRQSLEKHGDLPAELMLARIAVDTIKGTLPNQGVDPEASVAGKVLRNVPRNT